MDRLAAGFRTRRKWLWRSAAGLLAIYLLYLLAANVFLNTDLATAVINRQPEKFQMQWTRASSWWPGRVSLHGLKMQGHVRRTNWHAEAARASGRIALLPLLRKQVHVPDILAHEVTGGVARAASERPVLPSRAGGWTLRFDRIASDSIRRGVFDDLLLEGEGSGEVGFVKQLRGGPMELLPSQVRFRQTRLSYRGGEWLRDATLAADFAIARHRREEAAGIAKLLKTDARLQLQGTTAALDIKVASDGKVALAGVPGQGRADIDLAFARGLLLPGGHLHWSMPVTGNDITGAARHESLDLALQVDEDIAIKARVPPQAEGKLTVDADLRVRGREVPLADFARLLPRTSGHVMARWHFGSLRWLGDLFTQAPWLQLDGAGDVDADVQVVDGQLAAGSRIGVPEVEAVAQVMGNRIRGRARADIRLDAGASGELLPHLDAVMERFDIAAGDAPGQPYVEGRNLRLQLSAAPELAQLRDSLKARLTFSNARVPDLRVYNRYLPREHLRFTGGSGLLSGDLSLDGTGDVGHGWLRVSGRGTRMTVAGVDMRGDVGIDTRLRRANLKRSHFVVDGSTVDLKNVSFREAGGESRSGWWARIALPQARMDWQQPVNLGGNAQVVMKDVGFLLSLFSRQKEYPDWIYRLIDAGQAQVKGHVQWQKETLILDRMEAQNDRFDLLARLRLQGARRTGSLYAKWGVLSVGVELQGDTRRFHLVRARHWYDAQAGSRNVNNP